MSNVSCKVAKCIYNRNSTCYKNNINIEGLFTRSRLGTFCESFRTPKEQISYRIELNSEMQSESIAPLETDTKIKCSSNYCCYNTDGICTAEKIIVVDEHARFRSETQCDSFKLK